MFARAFDDSATQPKRKQGAPASPQDVLLLLFGPCMGLVAKFNHDWCWSCTMTLGQASMMLAVLQVLLRLNSGEKVGPISVQSLQVVAVAVTSRLIPTTFMEGYTPVDKTGNWLTQAFDAATLICTLRVLWLLRFRKDVAHYEWRWLAPVLILLSLGLALTWHAEMDEMVVFDVAWATATYALALAQLPQLLCLELAPPGEGAVPWAYLVPLCGAMFGSGTFWWLGYEELFLTNEKGTILSRTPGKLVLAAHTAWAMLLALCIGHNVWRAVMLMHKLDGMGHAKFGGGVKAARFSEASETQFV